jgi:putative DNA primase/helicase
MKLKAISAMLKLGCAVFPVVKRSKKPAIKKWTTRATRDRNKAFKYFRRHPEQNYGVLLGGPANIFVIEFDGSEGEASLKKLIEINGPLPVTLTVVTHRGRHHYVSAPPGFRVRNSVGRVAKGIDIRGESGFVLGAGSVHPSGDVYRFRVGRGPDEVKIARAPAWLLRAIRKTTLPSETTPVTVTLTPADLNRVKAYAEAARQRELDRLSKAPKHQRNDTLNKCAFKLGQFLPFEVLDRQTIAQQLAQVAAQIGLAEAEIHRTIESGLKAGSRYPRRLPFLKSSVQQSPAVPSFRRAEGDITAQLAKLGETDTDNAQRFATRHGHEVIFTPGRGWLVFDGTRHKPEATLECLELAKATARLIRAEIASQPTEAARSARANFAKQSLSKGSLERMLDLARGLLAVGESKLDSDPMLLNTETGTIDLRTGQLEKHDRRDLLTKIAPVAADPNARCPRFKRFLWRVIGGDKDLAHFIQKSVGYTLTGDTSEQVLFFAYGPGGSGKSTLVNTIRELVGDYGCHTPTETLLVKQYDNAIPADLARLTGVRMVTAIEANFNRHLDEARIKGMTGGEPITARFMRQNYFEFVPTFKLWLVANDRPRVRSTDSAFWRRVRVLPFSIEIPKSERDLNLSKELKAEWPGILAWAVRGCLNWQAEGLIEPACVQTATANWQKQVDHLKRFVEEMLFFSTDHQVQAASMYQAYSKWCSQNGEHRHSMRDFKSKLSETVDLTHRRVNGRGWWKGGKLKA